MSSGVLWGWQGRVWCPVSCPAWSLGSVSPLTGCPSLISPSCSSHVGDTWSGEGTSGQESGHKFMASFYFYFIWHLFSEQPWQLESVNAVGKQAPSLLASQKVLSYKQKVYEVLAQGEQCGGTARIFFFLKGEDGSLDVYMAMVSSSPRKLLGKAACVVTVW